MIDAAGFPVDGVGNTISGNSIHSNTRLGIELNHDAFVTPNDPGDADTGSNDVKNFPVITSVQVAGGSTTIQGTLNSEPQKTYTVEVFSNSSCNAVWDPNGLPDPQLAGEGETYLGSVSVSTDGAGDAAFTSTYPVTLSATDVVTATATNPNGSTSEFSTCADVTTATAGTIIVRKHTVPAGTPELRLHDRLRQRLLSQGRRVEHKWCAPAGHLRGERDIGFRLGHERKLRRRQSAANAITLSPGETVTCTFTNTQRGLAKVVKTVSGAAPSGSQSFTFELATGRLHHAGRNDARVWQRRRRNGGSQLHDHAHPGHDLRPLRDRHARLDDNPRCPHLRRLQPKRRQQHRLHRLQRRPGQTRSFRDRQQATPRRSRSNDRLLEELGLLLTIDGSRSPSSTRRSRLPNPQASPSARSPCTAARPPEHGARLPEGRPATRQKRSS